MVRLWKIMFDLVLIISVGVLLRLEGINKKNRLHKKNYFLKTQKLIQADKKKLSLSRNFCQLG